MCLYVGVLAGSSTFKKAPMVKSSRRMNKFCTRLMEEEAYSTCREAIVAKDAFLSRLLATTLHSQARAAEKKSGLSGQTTVNRCIQYTQDTLNEMARHHPGQFDVDKLDVYCVEAIADGKRLMASPLFSIIQEEVAQALAGV